MKASGAIIALLILTAAFATGAVRLQIGGTPISAAGAALAAPTHPNTTLDSWEFAGGIGALTVYDLPGVCLYVAGHFTERDRHITNATPAMTMALAAVPKSQMEGHECR